MSTRYIAVRINGDGTETIIDPELPLSEVSYTRKKNAPTEISGVIAPEYAYMFDEVGRPLLEKWAVGIFVETDDVIRAGGIFVDDNVRGHEWALDIMGYAGYPSGMPYTDSWVATDVDPLDVYRQIWNHLQSKPRGNLGVIVDQHDSGVKIGKMVAQGEFDTENGPLSFEYEPVRLAWYETQDLADSIAKLSEGTPFDFTEDHHWNADRSAIVHSIRLAYPKLGSRRHDVRFVLGENVQVTDLAGGGDEYADGVLALGAGEGSAMMRAEVSRPAETRLRRVVVLDQKDAQTPQAINAAAQAELRIHIGYDSVSSLQSYPDHSELDSINLGDEVRLLGDAGQRDVDMWVEVTGITVTPEGDGTVKFDVIRTDKITL